jgi:hypothetical protein
VAVFVLVVRFAAEDFAVVFFVDVFFVDVFVDVFFVDVFFADAFFDELFWGARFLVPVCCVLACGAADVRATTIAAGGAALAATVSVPATTWEAAAPRMTAPPPPADRGRGIRSGANRATAASREGAWLGTKEAAWGGGRTRRSLTKRPGRDKPKRGAPRRRPGPGNRETPRHFVRPIGVRLLVLNCHEAWIHQLGTLRARLDIVVGLPGRYTNRWDLRMRPLPDGARTVTLDEVRLSGASYDCVVNHNITDLLDTKFLDAPKLLVLHDTLEGRMAQQDADFDARDMRATLNSYLASVGGHAIAISRSKAKSWGVTHAVVPNSADPDAYLPWEGDVVSGLRVANHVTSKRVFLAWDFHEAALAALPLRIVGHNPDLPGVEAAESWDHLKQFLASHRFLVHTADPRYEDGYNMAVLEAMAAGMPVLTNRHPTTIVEHGVTGFVADTPAEMRAHAERLLGDVALAGELGANGRAFIARHHSPDRFRVEFTKAIAEARKKWSRRRGRAMVPGR